MLTRHGQHPLYTVQKAERWLEWLAWQMNVHHQATFYLERLQPDWLSERRSVTTYYACTGLIGTFVLGAAAGFIGALVHGQLIAVVLSIIGALLGGLGFVLVGTRIRPVQVLRFSSLGGRVQTFLLIASWLFILLDNILLHSSLSLFVTFLAVVSVIVLAISEALKDTPASRPDTPEIVSPGDGLRRSLKTGIFAGLLCGFGFNLIVGMLHVVISSSTGNLPIEYGLGAIFGLLCGLTFGGLAAIQIKIVQWLLSHTGVMPTNYTQFLDYATEHLLLRKVGGGYMFVHNLLLEHLASQYSAN